MTSATRHAAEITHLPIDDALVLQSAHTALLVAAARGEIDLNQMAREALADRGLDTTGAWVGFAAAAEQLRPRAPITRSCRSAPRPASRDARHRLCS